MSPADIRRVQFRLSELDLYDDAIDGKAGPNTTAALLDYALWMMFTQTAVAVMFDKRVEPGGF